MTVAPADRQLRLVSALRRYGAAHAGLMLAFARHLALHPTDAAALSEILLAEDLGAPLSPATLARRIGRSRPATTAVLDRLAAEGLVARAPHPSDGRATVLGAGPRIGAAIPQFFQPLSDAMAATLAPHDPAQVEALIAMVGEVTDCVVSQTPTENSSILE